MGEGRAHRGVGGSREIMRTLNVRPCVVADARVRELAIILLHIAPALPTTRRVRASG